MKRLTGWSCAWLIAVVLSGCGPAPRVRPLTPESVVLAFGDSLTAGTGADGNESYPAVLAGLLGCKVVNAGIPGETSPEGLDRLPEVLKQHKPDLVLLCHGGNDMLQKVNDEVITRNVRAMIEAAQGCGADVILLGVPRPGLFLRAPPFYAEVAESCKIPYEAKVLPEILSTRSLKSDAIHPNAEGYRKLAGRVAALIRKRGA